MEATLSDSQAPIDVLSRHGKSFRWAGRFLGRSTLADAATLYAFCRTVDDAVDRAPSRRAAMHDLHAIRQALGQDAPSASVLVGIQKLRRTYGLSTSAIEALIRGVASDIGSVRMATENDLLGYCYSVAGTVGELMCPILGATEQRAVPFAIDLGIGMQLTNIARDVLEDAESDRLYLPAERLQGAVTPVGLLCGASSERALATQCVVQLLKLAEDYYASAEDGLRYLPLRSRIAILIAARLYRAIGRKVLRNPQRIWQGRTYLNVVEKAALTLSAVIQLFSTPQLLNIGPRKRHVSELHQALNSSVSLGVKS